MSLQSGSSQLVTLSALPFTIIIDGLHQFGKVATLKKKFFFSQNVRNETHLKTCLRTCLIPSFTYHSLL